MKKFLYSLIVLLSMAACSPADEPRMSDGGASSSKYLTAQEAVTVAQKALVEFGLATPSRSYRTAHVELFNNPRSRSAATDTTFYIVNFTDGGFAVIDATRGSILPILALSEQGEFSTDKNPVCGEYLAMLTLVRDSIPKPGNGRLPLTPVPGGNDNHIKLPETKIDTITETINCEIPVKWGQEYPYNKYCPLVYISPYTVKYCVVGCVALTLGQISAYHRFPTSLNGYSLNWAKMLAAKKSTGLSEEGINDVAYLLRETGNLSFMQYSPYASSTTHSNAHNAALEMGFTDAVSTDSLELALNSMKIHGPVFISGFSETTGGRDDGHAWAIDGYKVLHVTVTEPSFLLGEEFTTTSYKELYLHFNWGWDGLSDGYYFCASKPAEMSFKAQGYNFNHGFNYIINMHK